MPIDATLLYPKFSAGGFNDLGAAINAAIAMLPKSALSPHAGLVTIGEGIFYSSTTVIRPHFVVANNIFDQSNSTVWNATSGLTDFTMTGNVFEENGNDIPVLFSGMTGFVVANNYMATTCSPSCPAYAIENVSGGATIGFVGMNFSNGFTTSLTNLGGTNNQSNWWTIGTSGADVYTAMTFNSTHNGGTQIAISPTSGAAVMGLTGVGAGSGGPAYIQLKGGASGAFVGHICNFSTTEYWRDGMIGSTAYQIKDGVASKVILNFPSNTMPANSITGNAAGPILLTVQTPTARKGTFVCTAAGTITIANTNEAVTSDVIISLKTAGGTISTAPAMKTVTAGTGFTVLWGAADTSTYNYNILN